MNKRSILGASLLLPLAAAADTFEFDFNDLSGSTGGPLQNTTGGAVAKDGGAFASASWPGGTSFVDAFDGDLIPTSPPTGYSIGQSSGTESRNIGYGDDQSARGRYQYRDIVDMTIGTTWISYLYDFNQDELGDGTDALMSPGLMFATSVQPQNLPTLGVTVEPSGTPGSPLTYVEWAPGGLRFDDGSTFQRGAQSADLGLAPNDVHLVLVKMDQGADTISVWVNPADVSSEGALGTPDLTATLGITSIPAIGFGCEGTGTNGPDGNPAEDIIAHFDQCRVSNQPNAFQIVTTTPDPILAQSPADSGAFPEIFANLSFGSTINSTGTTRTVEFVNNGPNSNITIEGVNILNDASGVFTVTEIRDFNGDPTVLPYEMFPTDTLQIDVEFAPAGATGTFTAELEVDTNEDTPENMQDKLLPITATEFAEGAKLLTNNNTLEAGLGGWANDRVTSVPGIAPGSSLGALLDQAGDGYFISSVFPAVPDFTVTYYFAVPELTAPVAGESNMLFRVRGAPFNPLTTLSHFPAGVDLSVTPGWYTFDGAGWNLAAGLGTVAGSIDADLNGSLNDPGDTKNVYKMTFVGREFGTLFFEYDITVTPIDGAAGGGTETGLIDFDALDPAFNLPITLAFEQRDGQLGGPRVAGLGNQFGPWVDDVCVFAGVTLPDPDLNVASAPSFGVLFNPPGPVTDALVLRNDGASDLSITDITFADTHFSVTPAPTFPIVIPGGGTASLDVQLDPGGDSGTWTGDITIESDDSVAPTEIVPLTGGSFSNGDKLFETNNDFETDPFDDQWINSGGVLSNAGIAPGSTTAAFVAAGQTLERSLASVTTDWELQFFFAVDDAAGRIFNLQMYNSGNGTALVNLRYEGGVWSAFSGAWQPLAQLNPVVGAAGGTNVYSMKIVGRGWGSTGATYDLFLSDLGGTTFTSAVTDLSFVQAGSLDDAPPTRLVFSAAFGGNPGFWVDDVCLTAGAPLVDDPNFSIASSPSFPLQLDDNSAMTADLVVENTGLNNTLNISDITLSGAPEFTVLTALPIMIAPGGQAPITIQFERGASAPGSFAATATVTTNDATTPNIDVLLAANSLADSGKLLENWDFELQDGSPFEAWDEVGEVLAVDGLVAGSTTAAYLSTGGDRLIQGFNALGGSGNFVVDINFAIKDTTGRAFNFVIISAGGGGNGQANIRYQTGNWFAFNGTPGQGGAWQNLIDMTASPLSPSIDLDGNGGLNDPTDTKVVYRAQVTCLGWGTPDPTFDLEVFDSAGTSLASTSGRTAFQNSLPTAFKGGSIDITSVFGGSPGFWVDDVCITSLEEIVIGELILTSVTSAGDDVTLEWTDIGSSNYSVERSFDGENFATIATGIGGTTYTDIGVLAGPDDVAIYRVFVP